MDNNQINEEKNKIYQEINELVYVGIHDVKSPIANLKLINRLLKTTDKLNEVKEYADMSIKSLAQLEVVIDGLAAALDLQSDNNLSAETLNFFQVLGKLKDTYEIELAEDFSEAAEIKYIPSYLNTLLQNIMSNSFNFRQDKGKAKLELTTRWEDSYLVLRAKDNGRGIDLNRYKSKIFMPFIKMQSTGAGIGLYLIKTIADKNGGKIKIESEVGVGTVLEVFLKEYEIN